MPSMRDVFWDTIYEDVLNDKDIIVLSADFGAIALDRYRVNLPAQYINTGISEQNTILTAAGLALSGKRVFVTSITPFITYRCFEQIRLYPSGMNLLITIVGVGAGICYEDSGPTHHGTEDISLLRILPHMKVLTPCDNIQTKYFAKRCLKSSGPSYIRLDRIAQNDIYKSDDAFTNGFRCVRPVQRTTIVSSGNMLHNALDIYNELKKSNIDIGVIDAYELPLDGPLFKEALEGAENIITIEEHNLAGGFGSSICEFVCDNFIRAKVKRFGFDFTNGFSYHYGGRKVIHEAYQMDNQTVVNYIKNIGD